MKKWKCVQNVFFDTVTSRYFEIPVFEIAAVHCISRSADSECIYAKLTFITVSSLTFIKRPNVHS